MAKRCAAYRSPTNSGCDAFRAASDGQWRAVVQLRSQTSQKQPAGAHVPCRPTAQAPAGKAQLCFVAHRDRERTWRSCEWRDAASWTRAASRPAWGSTACPFDAGPAAKRWAACRSPTNAGCGACGAAGGEAVAWGGSIQQPDVAKAAGRRSRALSPHRASACRQGTIVLPGTPRPRWNTPRLGNTHAETESSTHRAAGTGMCAAGLGVHLGLGALAKRLPGGGNVSLNARGPVPPSLVAAWPLTPTDKKRRDRDRDKSCILALLSRCCHFSWASETERGRVKARPCALSAPRRAPPKNDVFAKVLSKTPRRDRVSIFNSVSA